MSTTAGGPRASGILFALIAMTILVSAGAEAGIRRATILMALEAGRVEATSALTGGPMDGYRAAIGVETLAFGPVAIGFDTGYYDLEETSVVDGRSQTWSVETWPFQMTARGWVGGRVLAGYVGVAGGGHFATRRTPPAADGSPVPDEHQIQYSVTALAGGAIFPFRHLHLSAGVAYDWFNKSYFQDDGMLTVSIALGFQFDRSP